MARTPTRQARCARCGRPVEPGEHLCAQCREEIGPAADTQVPRPESELEARRRRWPASMVRPSPVQYHATIMVTIFVVLAGLAVWAFIGHHGVGPFDATVTRTTPDRNGTVTAVVEVMNQGSRRSRATCTFTALDSQGLDEATVTTLTPPIPGHSSVTVTATFRGLAAQPGGYRVRCS